jgi:hypothetical protein
MDKETINTLKTVCTAGCATEGYNGDCNDRLDQLVESGYLVIESEATPLGPGRSYAPSAKGRELFRELTGQGVA